MANKKVLNAETIKGVAMTIVSNRYGSKIEDMLSKCMHLTKNEKGQYVAIYFEKDIMDCDLEYLARQGVNFEYKYKEVVLREVCPDYLPRQDKSFEKYIAFMGMTCETTRNMTGYYSKEAKEAREQAKLEEQEFIDEYEAQKKADKNDFDDIDREPTDEELMAIEVDLDLAM